MGDDDAVEEVGFEFSASVGGDGLVPQGGVGFELEVGLVEFGPEDGEVFAADEDFVGEEIIRRPGGLGRCEEDREGDQGGLDELGGFQRWCLEVDDMDITDIGVLLEFVDEVLRWEGIEVEDGEGMAALVIAAQGHVGDIDLVFGEEAAEVADDARAIFIREDEEDAGGGDFDGDTIDTDDTGVVLGSEEGASGGGFVVVAVDGDVEPFIEVGFLVGFDFLDEEAACGGNTADIDGIDVLAAGGLEEAFENGAGDGVTGDLGCFSAVGEDEAVISFGGELGGEASEFFPEVEVRFDLGVGGGVEVGEVDGVSDCAIDEVIGDGFGDLDADVFLGFAGTGAEVWG